jgi:hypothetical protein
MRPTFAVSAIVSVTSFLAICPSAHSFGPDPEPARKIAHLSHEIIALDASLITLMSQAENSLSDDVESLHASIAAAQEETVDTFAAYHEAKSLIHDLEALRKDAIANLTLPSGYTAPNVVLEPPPSATSDPKLVLRSTYQDLATAMRLMVTEINMEAVAIEKRLEILAAKENDISFRDMFRVQALMNHLSQVQEASTSILSASNSAIANMARNVKQARP